MKGSGSSTWLSKEIREYFPDEVPDEEKSKLSAVSLRIGGITEMGVGNVGFIPVMQDPVTSLAPTKRSILTEIILNHLWRLQSVYIGGWADYNAPVYSPSLSCLNVPAEVMNSFLNKLVVNTLQEFIQLKF